MKLNQRRTRSRLYLLLFFGVVCLAGLMQTGTTSSSSSSQSPNKIALEVLSDTANGKSASVVIFLANQADLSAAYAMKDQDARGWFVYHMLTQHAARTQGDLQAFLKAQGVSYQSFWAAN